MAGTASRRRLRHARAASEAGADTRGLAPAYDAVHRAFTAVTDADAMINPYDPPSPDGPLDADDLPAPLVGPAWLDDDDEVDERDWRSDFSLVREDPE